MKTILVAVLIIAAYAYGVASVNYELFPYSHFAATEKAGEYIKVSKAHGASGRKLYEKLTQGGYIIYFRHNHRDKVQDVSLFDGLAHLTEPEIVHPSYKDGLCLNEYGRQQNWYLKRVFDALDLPIDKVVSSPICRCVETAEGVFGRVDELDYDMVYKTLVPRDQRDGVFERRRAALATAPVAGTNTVIVAHSAPVLRDVGLNIPSLVEGGAAILKPDASGEVHFVALLKPQDWLFLLEQKPVWEQGSKAGG